MRTRRRLLLFGLLAALAALTIGGWFLLSRSAITYENAHRLKKGMTIAEVEAILGGPARDETGLRPVVIHQEGRIHCWFSEALLIRVSLHFDGTVMTVEPLPMEPIRRESLLVMVRRWLHL
jgi:hypothetical protein